MSGPSDQHHDTKGGRYQETEEQWTTRFFSEEVQSSCKSTYCMVSTTRKYGEMLLPWISSTQPSIREFLLPVLDLPLIRTSGTRRPTKAGRIWPVSYLPPQGISDSYIWGDKEWRSANARFPHLRRSYGMKETRILMLKVLKTCSPMSSLTNSSVFTPVPLKTLWIWHLCTSVLNKNLPKLFLTCKAWH